jgi:hypothetical protein
MALTWLSQTVYKHNASLPIILSDLPTFKLESFGEGENSNEDLFQVVRQPFSGDTRCIPVGVVSKKYKLIQHTKVVEWLSEAFKMVGWHPQDAQARLYISRYGERVHLSISHQDADFDPGDGYPLRLTVNCQNSVERSCAFELSLIWLRLICNNGLFVRVGTHKRLPHTQYHPERWNIGEWLSTSLQHITKDQHRIREWYQIKVGIQTVFDWADSHLSNQWGKTDAARFCSVARHGWDGRVRRANDMPPSRWQVAFDTDVPGLTTPISNVYHASQALSWIASRTERLEERWERIYGIHDLVSELIQYSQES